MLTLAEQADRAAAGLQEHWRTQCGYVAGGEVAEHGGLLVTATRLPDETLNVAFATGPVEVPDEALDWLVGWFGSRGLRPGIELRAGHHPEVESLLAARGFSVVVRRPAMTLHPVAAGEVQAEVRIVETDADLHAFQAIQAEVFDMTPEVTAGFLPRKAIETPGITFLVAEHRGVACATSAVTASEYGAGIVGVATLPAYRRRGLGRAVTTAALHVAEGHDLAWLYPSAMAKPLYNGLGFATLDDVQVWVG